MLGDWRPFPGRQTEFCAAPDFEVLFGGAAGPGKTDCLLMVATRFIQFPEYSGIIFRRTFPQLQEIVDRCWRWYPMLGGQYRATEHRWYFPSGAKISLGHMQHEADMYNHQGKEYHFAGFDELTQFLKTQYLYIFSRVRGTNPSIPLFIRSTTNPGNIGHVWVKDRFIDVGPPGRSYVDADTGLTRKFIPARISDNPALCDSDPTYVRRLEALPEIERMRLLHGDWTIFTGQVFSELTVRTHGCEPFDVPPEWTRFVAFDWGYAKPWCCLYFAQDFDGVVYLYRELYGCKEGEPDRGLRQTNSEICEAILAAEKHDRGKINYRVADPACWSPTMKQNRIIGPSFQEDASKFGLYFMKADNDRNRGKQQVHQRFRIETETDKDGVVVREYPQFVAFNTAKNWWRTMTELREDPKNPEDVDTTQEDHLYDCTRYAFMSRPILPKKRVDIPAGTFAAERRRLIRAKEYAKRHGTSIDAAYTRVR